MDPLLAKLLEQGGLAGVAGVALLILYRTLVRHEAERKQTSDALFALHNSTLAAAKEQASAFTRLCERIETLLSRRGRGAA